MDKYIKTLLLSDSLYLTGFRLFDRKQMEKDKAKSDKRRLLGFEKSKTQPVQESREQQQSVASSPLRTTSQKDHLKQYSTQKSTPKPVSKAPKSLMLSSQTPNLQQQLWLKDLVPIDGASAAGGGGPTTVMHVSEQGYLQTNEASDLEMLAQFEEEQERRGHFDLIFP